ncbi:hypothetical protein RCL1_006419 [Eukaryota sp. TZLM3-RCL]
MDDVSLIAPIDIIHEVAPLVADLYAEIGLELNAAKCLLISNDDLSLKIRDVFVESINYSRSSFRFLGCYMGLKNDILKDLDLHLKVIEKELAEVLKLDIEKHLKFFILKICYSGKITHLLRSLDCDLSHNFCRSFNMIRTKFIADLLQVESSALRGHIFCHPDFGGIGFTSSKYLTKSAFIGGAKNFIYEFSKRYADRINLLNITSSSYLIALRREVTNLPPSVWSECFPSDIQEIPAREVVSLNLAFKKLQQSLVKVFEQKDYNVCLSLAKNNNPAFANFLLDLSNSTASAFFSQIPQVYGLLLNDHQWTTTMRLRCFLWPYNLPHDLICKCSKPLNFNHLLNRNHFITYRSILHDAVRDQIHAMAKSYKIESFVEPLLRKLTVNEDDDCCGQRRADVIVPSSTNKLTVVDVVTVDVCKLSAIKNSLSEVSPLLDADNRKFSKYSVPLSNMKCVNHVKYELCPFAVSLHGTFGKSALSFLDDFSKLVSLRHKKIFDLTLWKSRLVFTIFKNMCQR